jgi:CRISPR-associated endoribonuclease Cas6
MDGKKLYDGTTQTLFNLDSTIKLSFNDRTKDTKQVKIKFLTPVRIKVNSRYTTDITFLTLIKSILRRLALLSLYYFDKKIEVDFGKILGEASLVKTKSSHIKWVDFERYSTRQKTRMKLGGVIGEVVYEGNIANFVPLLKIGELTHIGKNTTFGLGKYEVIL